MRLSKESQECGRTMDSTRRITKARLKGTATWTSWCQMWNPGRQMPSNVQVSNVHFSIAVGRLDFIIRWVHKLRIWHNRKLRIYTNFMVMWVPQIASLGFGQRKQLAHCKFEEGTWFFCLVITTINTAFSSRNKKS